MKFWVSILMASLLSQIPQFATAEILQQVPQQVPQQMVSTATVIEELSREQTQQKILKIINEKSLNQRLSKLGLNQTEINKRLATLSDSELQKMAQQMDEAQYAGDGVVGVLLIVVLVLLIIYLAKRI